MDETQQAEAPLEKVVEVFEHGGKTYVYDYDSMKGLQITNALSQWKYLNHIECNMPKDYRSYEMADPGAVELKAYAHMLTLQLANGDYAAYDARKAMRDTIEFIGNLPPDQFDKLERCKWDFFTRRKFLPLGSVAQLKPLIDAFASVESQSAMIAQIPTAKGLLPVNENLQDSSSQANQTAD
jgi:hypothetical protein